MALDRLLARGRRDHTLQARRVSARPHRAGTAIDASPVVAAARWQHPLRRLGAWPARHAGIAFLLLIFGALLGGLLAARLPVERVAAPSLASVRVDAELPGFDPAVLENLVVRPLEHALAGVPDMARYESRSRRGAAAVRLWFGSVRGRDGALEEVRRRVLEAYNELPAGIDVPVVTAESPPAPPAAIYRIEAPERTREVVEWVRHILLDPLRELPDVATVTVEGLAREEILIEPDPRRLAGLGLSFDDLIHALRQEEQAPRRSTRGVVILPAGAEAIAARAVRLPNGEPIALAEVARVALVPAPDAKRAPAAADLRAVVYARSSALAPHVAERAAAHLAWLRANGVVPRQATVRAVHDEARAAVAWRRQVVGRAVLAAGALLGLVLIAFGGRILAVVALAFAVWVPAALGAYGLVGLTLNAHTAAALVLASLPFAMLTLLPASAGTALAAAAAAAASAAVGAALGLGRTGLTAFAATLPAGVLVRWLMSPWARPQLAAVFARGVRWWPGRRAQGAFAALLLLLPAWAVVSAAAYALLDLSSEQGMWRLRLVGQDRARLAGTADGLLPSLAAIGHVDQLATSTRREETWRLHLDAARLAQVGIVPAEVGRAVAVATDGLPLGEVRGAERTLPLRLRLPADAAGDSFERLLLRGERERQPAVYLRDVGLVERVELPWELQRVDGRPAVEITARWRGRAGRAALKRVCGGLALPEGYASECVVLDAPVATYPGWR